MVTIQEVWYGDSSAAKLARALLWPLSLIYALGWQIYLLVYRIGLKRAYRPHCKVLCIGNFTVGGTGKTPTVVFVAHCLSELGIPFVIGCSGYGAPHSVGATIAPTGPLAAAEWGDEPAEIRDLLPNVPLIVGRARVTASKLSSEAFPESVLLMDDGFQHMPLRRDVSIILDPPLENRLTFPAGPYREPRRSGAKRADFVIPSPDFTQLFSTLTFTDPSGEVLISPARARVITAIGRPDNFRQALEAEGVSIVEFLALPDHDKLEINLADKESDLPWLVTRKDWVKLQNHCDLNRVKIVLADRSASIEPADEFKKWLKIRLG